MLVQQKGGLLSKGLPRLILKYLYVFKSKQTNVEEHGRQENLEERTVRWRIKGHSEKFHVLGSSGQMRMKIFNLCIWRSLIQKRRRIQ